MRTKDNHNNVLATLVIKNEWLMFASCTNTVKYILEHNINVVGVYSTTTPMTFMIIII